MEAQNLLEVVKIEMELARTRYPKFNSWHEGYGVLLEELDEFWTSLKNKKPDSAELLSVAAVSLLMISELSKADEDPQKFIDELTRGLPGTKTNFAKILKLKIENE